ncbi:hypothetical protein F5884DRAFT_750313 [Xylogone sp. PMI_703]|nr:hypothetical protein F5884DRAFT_750313 [Xylogone sp. PMI_703]
MPRPVKKVASTGTALQSHCTVLAYTANAATQPVGITSSSVLASTFEFASFWVSPPRPGSAGSNQAGLILSAVKNKANKASEIWAPNPLASLPISWAKNPMSQTPMVGLRDAGLFLTVH